MSTAFVIASFFVSTKAYFIPFRKCRPFSQFVVSDKKEIRPGLIGRYRFVLILFG
ncbi:hypothetical protein BC941DRAFT_420335 [Chlamydoabsidia padenii]|nr:hypothetical protein BC941DRAFT_420335 [Chlamydoabsidia padenii]